MKLFFRKYGDGPPLIILHGLYGSADNWVSIAKNISNKFTVFLPDLRNHGNSPHSEIHDYFSMSDDIIEFAVSQNLERFFLAGHSMGGKVAIAVAIRHPELILGLVVADISPFAKTSDTEAAVSEHSKILRAILNADLMAAGKREDVDSQLIKEIGSPDVRALIMKNLQRTSDGSFRWKLNAEALYKNLGNITGGFAFEPEHNDPVTGFPVTFLKGENSGYITSEGFRDILRIFPGAELRVIKDAGHWVQADNPAAVTEALNDLLIN